MKFKCILRWSLVALLWAGFSVQAGFSLTRLGIESVTLGGETADYLAWKLARSTGSSYPPITEALPPDQWDRLKAFPKFKDLTNDVARMEKLVGTRVMVLIAIEALKREDPVVAECLARLHQKGLISLAWTMGRPVSASLAVDHSPDYGTEPLNLYHYPCGEVPLYDAEFFRLVDGLAQEAQRAVQPRLRFIGPDTYEERTRYSIWRQANEIEVAIAALGRVDDLLQVLQSIIQFGHLPDVSGGLAEKIGSALLNDPSLNGIQRIAAARSLSVSLGSLRAEASTALEFRQAYRRALELFQQGGKYSLGGYNALIQESGWYHETTFRKELGATQPMTYRAGGGRFVTGPDGPATEFQPLPIFIQYNNDGLLQQFLLPGRSISDCFQLRDKRHLLVAGTDTLGMGVVWGLEDTNADGYYESNSLRELFRDKQLGGGLRWVWDRSEMALLGVNRRTANVYSFALPMTGGFPDQWTPMGSVEPRGDLREFWSRDGVLYGAADLGVPLSGFDVYATAERVKLSGAFVPTMPYVPRSDAWYRPALGQLPFTGANFLEVRAVPNHTIEVQGRKSEGSAYSLGTGKTDWSGSLSVKLKSPLELNSYIRVQDAEVKASSVEELVKTAETGLRIGIDLLPGGLGNLGLSYSYKPFTKLQVQYAEHFDDWESLGSLDLGGFGKRTVLTAPPALMAGFFRAQQIQLPALAAVADQYISGPGLTLRANVLKNDVAPPGTRVVLDSDPAADSSLFAWPGDGSFTLTAPITGPTSLRFKYHLQRDDGTRSDTVTVDITLSFTALTQFATYSGADGQGMVYVPCLYLPILSPLGTRLLLRPFPMYQFRLANNPMDVCGDPHWHAHAPVFSLPSVYEVLVGLSWGSLTDPDSGRCGFGRFKQVPSGFVAVPLTYWNLFFKAHPIPL